MHILIGLALLYLVCWICAGFCSFMSDTELQRYREELNNRK